MRLKHRGRVLPRGERYSGILAILEQMTGAYSTIDSIATGEDSRSWIVRLRTMLSWASLASTEEQWEFGVATTGRAKIFLDGELLIDNWSEQKRSRAFFSK